MLGEEDSKSSSLPASSMPKKNNNEIFKKKWRDLLPVIRMDLINAIAEAEEGVETPFFNEKDGLMLPWKKNGYPYVFESSVSDLSHHRFVLGNTKRYVLLKFMIYSLKRPENVIWDTAPSSETKSFFGIKSVSVKSDSDLVLFNLIGDALCFPINSWDSMRIWSFCGFVLDGSETLVFDHSIYQKRFQVKVSKPLIIDASIHLCLLDGEEEVLMASEVVDAEARVARAFLKLRRIGARRTAWKKETFRSMKQQASLELDDAKAHLLAMKCKYGMR